MTRLLEQAVATARILPEAQQDELACIILQLTGADQSPVLLMPEEESALDESLAEAEGGVFATDEDVRAVWAKHGL